MRERIALITLYAGIFIWAVSWIAVVIGTVILFAGLVMKW